jgi:hypothetical protein
MLKGTRQTEGAKAKIAEAMRGRRNPNWGKTMSDLNRKNVGRIMKSCWQDPAWRAKWWESRWGRRLRGQGQT